MPDDHNPTTSPSEAESSTPTAAPARSFGAVLRRLGPAAPLAVVAATLPAVGGVLLLWKLNDVGLWLRSHDEVGILLYLLAFAACAGLALLPTYAQAALGGWAFGFAIGFPAALGGFLGGALIGYGIALRATGERVIQLIDEKPKWKAVYQALLQSGFWRTLLIVTLVRIPLNSPFAITNLVMAATRVPPVAYVLGTLFGMAPRTAAAVFLAAGVREVAFESTKDKWLWIASFAITIVVVIIVGHIANKAIARVTAGQSPRASTP